MHDREQASGSGDPVAERVPTLAQGWAFFLDVDGTLLEHAEYPQAVRVGAELLRLLERLLGAAGGAVALISGRAVADIERLFAPLAFPAAGQHGTERRPASGELHRHAPPQAHLRRTADELGRIAQANGGLLFEDKGASLALHYRGSPGLRGLAEREMRRVAAALGDGFELQTGKFVFEIKPSGKDKGTAIAEFMSEAPFAGRVPVFIGDDLTDEYGFALVNRFGGHSVKVGLGETRALWRLADAAAVRRWLGEYVERFGAKGSAGAVQ